MVLAHPEIERVTVRVEKLEVGPGSVGVQITRRKNQRRYSYAASSRTSANSATSACRGER